MIKLLLIMLLLFPSHLLAMSDWEANRKARELWGNAGLAFRFRQKSTTDGLGPWTYQVGCRFNKFFILVGEGDTWEKAFQEVNMYLNGSNLTWAKDIHMCTSIKLRISVADPE